MIRNHAVRKRLATETLYYNQEQMHEEDQVTFVSTERRNFSRSKSFGRPKVLEFKLPTAPSFIR